jgi:hypothetical protein
MYSSTWALQPTTREAAKIVVKNSLGKPAAASMPADQ